LVPEQVGTLRSFDVNYIFTNANDRRAKIKNIAKRSIESGEDCDSIPDSMRQYLAMHAYGPRPVGGMPGQGFPYGNAGLMLNTDTTSGKTVIQHFHCRSLSVGTWRRVGQSTMDLVIFYSPEKACITYYIHNDAAGYKIEYPFAWIKNISLEQGDVQSAAEGASQRSGGLIVELTRPPKFYMDSSGSGGFYECGDFTEDQQASRIFVHHLGGPSKVLSGQLAKLVSLESYQNRHHVFDPSAFSVTSAPVSPVVHRPASQPNHMVHPHHQMNHLFAPDHTSGLMGPPAPRGHKRQRSRSVPAAIDFSMIRQPMPSFLIQHESQAQAATSEPALFAPQPQYNHQPNFAPGPAPGLSIDTSAQYGMNFGFAGPMSATTVNSPSDFGTPAFFAHGSNDAGLQPQVSTPYNNGFLAVDQAAMIGTTSTPLSMASGGDPVIADHSPPLNAMGRSQSADIFGTPGDNSQFSDDGLYLSESFNKQMALPFRSPMNDEFNSPMPDAQYNFEIPQSADSSMSLPYRGQDGALGFQSPPHQTPDHMSFQSPTPGGNMHQDSGIAFSTPSHIPHDQQYNFNSPKDTGMVYQESKVYQSPAPMQHMVDDNNVYQQSPLGQSTPGQASDMDMQNMGLYIDPNNLSQQHH
jgi:hypothetical protein